MPDNQEQEVMDLDQKEHMTTILQKVKYVVQSYFERTHHCLFKDICKQRQPLEEFDSAAQRLRLLRLRLKPCERLVGGYMSLLLRKTVAVATGYLVFTTSGLRRALLRDIAPSLRWH